MPLSTAESEYISITKGAAHALEVRNALVACGMTFKVVCETDPSAGRAMVTRCGVGCVRQIAVAAAVCARKAWLRFEADLGTNMVDLRRMTSLLQGTPLRPPTGRSSWMVVTTLTTVAEAAKDCRVSIWKVRNMCETSDWFWICVGMVIAILTVLSDGLFGNPISDDCSRLKETDVNPAWRTSNEE